MKQHKMLCILAIGGLLFLMVSPIQADETFLRRNVSLIRGSQSAISGELTPVNQPEPVWVGLAEMRDGVPNTQSVGYVHILADDGSSTLPAISMGNRQSENRAIHEGYKIGFYLAAYSFETRNWYHERGAVYTVNANGTFPLFSHVDLTMEFPEVTEDTVLLYRVKAVHLNMNEQELSNSTKTGVLFIDFPPYTNDGATVV